MTTQITQQNWAAFQALNQHRRAIRKFNPTSIPEEDIQEVLAEAMLAPSSGNLQPYQLHWIRNANLKAEIAKACHGQQAASTAAEIIVIAALALPSQNIQWQTNLLMWKGLPRSNQNLKRTTANKWECLTKFWV